MPKGVKGHRSLSSTTLLLSGIDLIKAMSLGRKRTCNRGVFQDTFFHIPSLFGWYEWSLELWDLHRKWYPDLTEYMPKGVKGHRSLSSTTLLLSGIDLIKAISIGRKRTCNRGVFQEADFELIRADTVTSSKPLTDREAI